MQVEQMTYLKSENQVDGLGEAKEVHPDHKKALLPSPGYCMHGQQPRATLWMAVGQVISNRPIDGRP